MTVKESAVRSHMHAPAKMNSVKVLSKAFAALDALSDTADLTPAELSLALGEPRSTIYRLLTALAEHDYVEPGARRGSYQLSLKLYTYAPPRSRPWSAFMTLRTRPSSSSFAAGSKRSASSA